MHGPDRLPSPLTSLGAGFLRWHLAQAGRPWILDGEEALGAQKHMQLATLLNVCGIRSPEPIPELDITGVSGDSRYTSAGDLFVVVHGSGKKEMEHVAEAVGKGALALVAEDAPPPGACPLPAFLVQDARRALANLADRFFNSPSKALKVVGITGTNGKTTTACMTRAALDAAGLPAGFIGTIGYETGRGSYEACNTTPGADRLQALLHEMLLSGKKSCVMEVSSHALVQGRVDRTHFACGIFTNLSREHLDYHGSMEEYLDAKAELFRRLPEDSVAVLNRDDPAFEILAGETRARVVSFGLEQGGDFRACIQRMDERGFLAAVRTPMGVLELKSGFLGPHNVSNMLAALAAACSLGVDPEDAIRGLAKLKRVAGRLARVALQAPFSIFIDYAHTPDALDKVLRQLRALVEGRLWVLFGCGGERDRGKRPLMARAVERWADRIALTSDNPRGENPLSIQRDVMAGFRAPCRVLVEPDRETAIRTVLSLAQEGDLVLLAGKGHESYQLEGGNRLPFNERTIVERFFSKS